MFAKGAIYLSFITIYIQGAELFPTTVRYDETLLLYSFLIEKKCFEIENLRASTYIKSKFDLLLFG